MQLLELTLISGRGNTDKILILILIPFPCYAEQNMALSETLVLVNRREKAGSTGSNRYDFQKDWTVGKILELHSGGTEYCVLCDYHEDVVVLDSENSPTAGTFIQVKTQKDKKPWSPESLVKSEKAKDGKPLGSIVGKLYNVAMSISDCTPTLQVVSNAPFKFLLKTDKTSLELKQIPLSEIAEKDLSKIRDAVKEQCGLDECEQIYTCIFEVTHLSLEDHATHTTGKVADFLDSLGLSEKAGAAALYRTLFDTVKRKTDYEAEILTFDELRAKKAIGKSYLANILKDISARSNSAELWASLHSSLQNEGYSAMKIAKARNAWDRYEVDRMNPLNEVLTDARKCFQVLKKEIFDNDEDYQVSQLPEVAKKRFPKAKLTDFTNDYLLVMAFRELYES